MVQNGFQIFAPGTLATYHGKKEVLNYINKNVVTDCFMGIRAQWNVTESENLNDASNRQW